MQGHTRERLLDRVFADIHRDSVEPPAHKTPGRASFGLLRQLRCGLARPTSLATAAEPAVAQATPKPILPIATFDLWSSPAAADIYLDGGYVGKTPYTVAVALGEHDVVLRKSEFGTWQTKIQAVAGPRRVGAYLERRLLTLP